MKDRIRQFLKRCVVWLSKRRWPFDWYSICSVWSLVFLFHITFGRLSVRDQVIVILHFVLFVAPGHFALEFLIDELAAVIEESEES